VGKKEQKEEGAEGSLDRSTEDEFQIFEKITKLTVNSEVLKEALEQLSSQNGKASVEVGDLLNRLTSQIHDVSVRVGDNPAFVGSQHDSIWNGISRVQENLDSHEATYNTRLNALVTARVGDFVKEYFAVTKFEIDRETQIRGDNQLRMEKQIKDLQAQHSLSVMTANASLMAIVGDLKQDIRHLKQEMSIHKREMADLKLYQL
jgi:hypothetical protein